MMNRRLWSLSIASAGMGIAACMIVAPAHAQDKSASEWVVPARAAQKKNPIPATPASIAAGKIVYLGNCLSCHGKSGKGDGPAAAALTTSPGDLSNSKMWQLSDGAAFWKITEGRAPMTTFKTLLTDEQRWQVVSYMRTLAPPIPLTTPEFAAPESTRKAISGVLVQSFALQEALAKDDLAAAQAAVATLGDAMAAIATMSTDQLDPKARDVWSGQAKEFAPSQEALRQAKDLSSLRSAFRTFSEGLIRTVHSFGHDLSDPPVQFQCETAFDSKGASWIQADFSPRNPYLGSKQPVCAKPQQRLAAQPEQNTNPAKP